MPIDIETAETPSLLRRLAAIFYDCLLLFAILTLADALVVLPLGVLYDIQPAVIAAHPAFRLYLLAVIVGFFCWFWLRGGQTLGMRAWRIMLVRDDGRRIGLRDVMLRQALAVLSWAAFGVGFIWSLFDAERLTWHDKLTATRLVLLAKASAKKS
jgi:uncharacterized RDD family membrane protein YckC